MAEFKAFELAILLPATHSWSLLTDFLRIACSFLTNTILVLSLIFSSLIPRIVSLSNSSPGAISTLIRIVRTS